MDFPQSLCTQPLPCFVLQTAHGTVTFPMITVTDLRTMSGPYFFWLLFYVPAPCLMKCIPGWEVGRLVLFTSTQRASKTGFQFAPRTVVILNVSSSILDTNHHFLSLLPCGFEHILGAGPHPRWPSWSSLTRLPPGVSAG